MYSTALLIRGMQIKFAMRCHHLPPEWQKLKRWKIWNVDKDVKQLASNTLLVRLQIGTTNLRNDLALSVKAEHTPF